MHKNEEKFRQENFFQIAKFEIQTVDNLIQFSYFLGWNDMFCF